MARELHCSDAGMQCEYIAKGENDDEVMGQAGQHVMTTHSEVVAGMSEEDQGKLMATARTLIHDSSIHEQ